MTSKQYRIGFIGLNPDSHWAATAHVPALKSLSDRFSIDGVANSTPESAKRTADALGIQAYDSAGALCASPDIDIVVVTVKVPHHLELVTTALNAGKNVYCEWPLGNGIDEARQLAALAAEKGVVAVCGTQARMAVEVAHLRGLVMDGFVGKVLSTTLVGSGGNWSGETVADLAYLFDAANGATMQSIPLAHTLAAVGEVLGPIARLDGQFASNFKTVNVTDSGETRPKTAPDQIMATGTLESGAALVVHYRGGSSRGTNLLWEINGSEGDIQVTGTSGHGQMTQLSLRGARGSDREMAPLDPPASAYEGLPDSALVRNVAGVYARMADDLDNGTRTAPSFADAVRLHEVVDMLEQTAKAKS
ncbi:Gfo/Idh/MocA family protein [Jiella marina]|uniref:Gfo/Idh/MocA family protein n=1 Tax=Jiella sp. LLJ827 TaxID=2917712 RepID=UPI002100D5F0|nr:Gfo/Idh/MocA family oxidoreductase [Jiella sp. LLJ827]MCQ0988788.1 Gfo/Idh/MocA family oxidoreductase [Jiella sp. LLJ827]